MGLIFAKLCFLCMDTDRRGGGGKLSVNQGESQKAIRLPLKKKVNNTPFYPGEIVMRAHKTRSPARFHVKRGLALTNTREIINPTVN